MGRAHLKTCTLRLREGDELRSQACSAPLSSGLVIDCGPAHSPTAPGNRPLDPVSRESRVYSIPRDCSTSERLSDQYRLMCFIALQQ